MNLTKLTENYNSLEFILTQRVNTARDMHDIMVKLNTEQETSGEFDILCSDIKEELEPHKIWVDLMPSQFLGTTDVVFELKVVITMQKDCQLDNKDLVKEHILGSVLAKIKAHFNCYYISHYNCELEVIKRHFRGY